MYFNYAKELHANLSPRNLKTKHMFILYLFKFHFIGTTANNVEYLTMTYLS